MGDIDFDELDKAVNSLMSSADAPKAHKKAEMSSRSHAPKATTVHRRHSPALRSTPAVAKSAASKPAAKTMDMRSTQSSSASKTKSTPAARRSGRFMDVVDASSELNPIRNPIVLPARETPRKFNQFIADPEPVNIATPIQASVVAPEPESVITSPSSVPKLEKDDSDSESVQVRLVAKSVPTPSSLQMLQENPPTSAIEIMKDDSKNDDVRPAIVFGAPTPKAEEDVHPIAVNVEPKLPTSLAELAGTQLLPREEPRGDDASELTTGNFGYTNPDVADETIATTETTPAIDTSLISVEPVQVAAEDTSNESESPFLSGATIEKRPLNANPTVVSEPVARIIDTPILAKSEPLEQSDPIIDEPYPMPMIPHEQPQASEVPELASELVAIEATGRAEYELDEAPVPIKSSTDGNQKKYEHSRLERTAGPTSISQQYQAKESTGDPSHAPIYDTTEYAEPVAHPAKKKSGWIWVLVIFLILALGSGGAVALYFAGIIP